MSDNQKTSALLAEYRIDRQAPVAPGVTRITAGHDGHAMTDEIIRLRDENASLRDENAALRAEIDRLRVRCRQIDDEAYDYAEQIEQLKAAAKDSERAERILAALRKPSKEVWGAALEAYNHAPFTTHTPRLIRALISAVEAAEQEVGRE